MAGIRAVRPADVLRRSINIISIQGVHLRAPLAPRTLLSVGESSARTEAPVEGNLAKIQSIPRRSEFIGLQCKQR